jgi:hypothetical protein
VSVYSLCMILVRCFLGVVSSLLMTMSTTVDHLVGAVPYLNSMFIMVECALLRGLLVVSALQCPICRPEAEEALFSCILEKSALNLAGVISWFIGAMLVGFLKVLINSITSGMGSLTLNSPFIMWSAHGEVPSNPMRSARGPVANGVFHYFLRCLSFCSRRVFVTLVLSLSRFQSVTPLEGGSCGFWGIIIYIRPFPMSLLRCFLEFAVEAPHFLMSYELDECGGLVGVFVFVKFNCCGFSFKVEASLFNMLSSYVAYCCFCEFEFESNFRDGFCRVRLLIPQVRLAHKYPIPPWEMIHPPGGDNPVRI